MKVSLPDGQPFKPSSVIDAAGGNGERTDFEAVVIAIGMRREQAPVDQAGLFYAGDAVNGPTTVVEAVAAGKNAALQIDAWLGRSPAVRIEKSTKSVHALPGRRRTPISLETDFFGRKIRSPVPAFRLAADRWSGADDESLRERLGRRHHEDRLRQCADPHSLGVHVHVWAIHLRRTPTMSPGTRWIGFAAKLEQLIKQVARSPDHGIHGRTGYRQR